jgi:GGDEF domain-containing protein
MLADRQPRRVLLVAEPSPDLPLEKLFTAGPLAGWQAVPADSFAAARFVLQHHPCDLLVIDGAVYQRDGADAFDWLAGRHQLPAVVLAGAEDPAAVRADEGGTLVRLPAGPGGPDPQLLAAALDQADRLGRLQRSHRHLGEELQQSRRQVDRLVGLMWRTLPQDADRCWLSQRHMLERLREELARARRYGNPLTVALGEVQAPAAGGEAAEALPDWAAEQVARGKRGCDLAGQYGPQGFMLLLVNTPPEGGAACCGRLKGALEQGGPAGPVRAYFGLAAVSEEVQTAQRLLRRAEEQLEAAKQQPACRPALPRPGTLSQA